MNIAVHNQIVNFIWGIADDCLRDVYVRGKYRNVILPMTVIRPPNRGPERCHELTGGRKGQLSVDLEHPYRLIFIPNHEPIPRKPDGGLDWKLVTSIMIIGIEDTHE